MKENGLGSSLEDHKIDIKFKLTGLWITLMLLYIYCDIFGFYRPGHLNTIISGFMGPFPVTQFSLLTGSILMIIPSIMVLICLLVKAPVNRLVNIVVGILYVLVSIGNIIGESWVYYLTFGVLEILIAIAIVFLAIKWPTLKSGKE
jgi:hypothetical protein